MKYHKGVPIATGIEYKDEEHGNLVYYVAHAPEGLSATREMVEVKHIDSEGTYYTDINELKPSGKVNWDLIDIKEWPQSLHDEWEHVWHISGGGVVAAVMTTTLGEDDPMPALTKLLLELSYISFMSGASAVLNIGSQLKKSGAEAKEVIAKMKSDIKEGRDRIQGSNEIIPPERVESLVREALKLADSGISEKLAEIIMNLPKRQG